MISIDIKDLFAFVRKRKDAIICWLPHLSYLGRNMFSVNIDITGKYVIRVSSAYVCAAVDVRAVRQPNHNQGIPLTLRWHTELVFGELDSIFEVFFACRIAKKMIARASESAKEMTCESSEKFWNENGHERLWL